MTVHIYFNSKKNKVKSAVGMNAQKRALMLFLVGASAMTSAFGDLLPAFDESSGESIKNNRADSIVAEARATGPATLNTEEWVWLQARAAFPTIVTTDNLRDGETKTDHGTIALVLPPSPNSAALCLWALGSVGAWRLIRTTKKWAYSATTPEWMHAEAVAIGHVQPFDGQSKDDTPAFIAPQFETAFLGLQPSGFTNPLGGLPCYAKLFRTVLAPRGPPVRL